MNSFANFWKTKTLVIVALLFVGTTQLSGQNAAQRHSISSLHTPPVVDSVEISPNEHGNDFVPLPTVEVPDVLYHDTQVVKTSYNSGPNSTAGESEERRQPIRDMTTLNEKSDQFAWTYKLQNLSHTQFEQKLEEIWGDRLTFSPLDNESRVLRLFLPAGNMAPEASMIFDRLQGLLTYEGSANRRKGWGLLMRLLDQPENPGRAIGFNVIDVGMADPGFVRQVSYSIQGQDQDQDSAAVPLSEFSPEQLKRIFDQEIPKLNGPIDLSVSRETNTIILKGPKEEIAILRKFINEVLMENVAGDREIKFFRLFNGEPDDLQMKITEIYEEQFRSLHGPARISSNPAANSILVVGSKGAIDIVGQLVRNFDGEETKPVEPGTEPAELSLREKGFQTFVLQHISAIEAQNAVNTLFNANPSAQTADPRQPQPVSTQVNQRTNALTVIASPALIRRAEAFIKSIDVDPGDPSNKKNVRVLRVFPIRNHRAGDFAVILQDALNGGQQQNTGVTESQIQATNNNQQLQTQDGTNRPVSSIAALRIADENGNTGRAGDFFDVRITADNPSNSVIINAREESMELIEQLIQQLDKAPGLSSEVKVFPVINGDASEVLETLRSLFEGDDGGGGAAGQTTGSLADLPLQSPASDGSSLINIRFAVNERLNTIIAAGPQSDLEFVEALIYRLDEKDVQERQTGVYRLSNANVVDVVAAIDTMLVARQAIIDANPLSGGAGTATGVISARRNVIIVEEETSNSLILNARPEYFAEIEHIIYSLDRRPPMVKVKAMIVEVDLNQLENYGVDFGIQDSNIFDAGLVDTIGTGFVGLNNPAGQLLSDLGVGRASAAAGGISGLLLSAGDESLNFVIRSLKQKGCAEILFSPQVMTLENLTGAFRSGASIQRSQGTNATLGVVTQDFVETPVGINLAITPRVTPDGLVVMFVDVSNTSLGSIAEGTAIGVDMMGNQIISQPINETVAQTTIMARSGQTVAISGLFEESKSQTINSVPFLGDLPVIGPLFQSVENTADRSELLIIMTPYIVDGPEDIDQLNEDDFSRMHWCKCDVAELYGNTDFDGGHYHEHTPKIYRPDDDPRGENPQFAEAAEPDFGQEGQGQQQNLNGPTDELPQQQNNWTPRDGSGNRNGVDQFLDQNSRELPIPQSNYRQQPNYGTPTQPRQVSQPYPPASVPSNYVQQLPAASFQQQQPNYSTNRPPPAPPHMNRQPLPPQRQARPSGPLAPVRSSNSNYPNQQQHNLTDRSPGNVAAPQQTYTGQPIGNPQQYPNGQQGTFNAGSGDPNRLRDQSTGRSFRLIENR